MVIESEEVSFVIGIVIVVEFAEDSIESIQCSRFGHLLVTFSSSKLSRHQLTMQQSSSSSD
ncbi:hypothetical protein KR52_13010 [Synechococcus sp. KORDI-52]|nr:hypothetical protein KR52_13010 [Synechococcus sp. KORDI-52]